MKVNFQTPLVVQFDSSGLDRACEIVKDIRHKEDSEEILDSLLALLLMRAAERDSPGTINGILQAASAVKPAP